MSVKEQKPIVIFRGDNTAAFDLRTIKILLTGDLDLTNAAARFDLLGFTKSWTTEEVATGELSIVFDAAQTKAFALGPQMGTLRLFDMSTGTPRQLTVVNKIPFFVTNSVCEIGSQSYGINVSVTSGETIHIEFNVGLDAVEGKADKVEDATAGDLASLTEDGNLLDSGIPADDVQRKLTFDTTPTEGSQNPVTSDGIKRAIDAATPEDYDQVKSQVEQNTSNISTNADNIATINSKIPSAASASNKLADKNFVNSSIATNTATFRGTYNAYSELNVSPPYPLTTQAEALIAAAIAAKLASFEPPVIPENNDYCFVQIPRDTEDPADFDPTVIDRVDRYKCTVTESGGVTTSVWEYEWSLNNSSFTADQWAAINSGMTAEDVTKLAGIEAGAQVNTVTGVKGNAEQDYRTGNINLTPSDIGAATSSQGAKADTAYQKPSGGIPKSDLASDVQTSLGKADTALQTAPVTSVNSKTGAVTLTASDVGAVAANLGTATNLTLLYPSIGGSASSSGDIIIVSGQTIPPSGAKCLELRTYDGEGNVTSTKYWNGKITQDGKTFTLPSATGTLALLQNLAPDFSTSATYAVNNLCVYGSGLYRCTTAIETAEAWDFSHWTEATVQDVLGALSYQISLKASIALVRDALALKAPLASPAFTGTPTAPNLTAQSADGQVANKKYVDDKVAGVSVTPLSGQTFDFATMQGIFAGVKACIEALGGSVTNFPTIPVNE